MARTWPGLKKAAEECNEFCVELMKLLAFPSGKHPARKRSVIVSTEDEAADVLAAVDYFIDRNALNRKRIERRKKTKYKKFCGWWGEPVLKVAKPKKAKTKKVKKPVKNATPKARFPSRNA